MRGRWVRGAGSGERRRVGERGLAARAPGRTVRLEPARLASGPSAAIPGREGEGPGPQASGVGGRERSPGGVTSGGPARASRPGSRLHAGEPAFIFLCGQVPRPPAARGRWRLTPRPCPCCLRLGLALATVRAFFSATRTSPETQTWSRGVAALRPPVSGSSPFRGPPACSGRRHLARSLLPLLSPRSLTWSENTGIDHSRPLLTALSAGQASPRALLQLQTLACPLLRLGSGLGGPPGVCP